jgi:cytoskeletal protein RodZ
MEDEKQPSLFEELKNLRQQKGISLKTVAESSRIQIKYLEALEKGDLLKIPEVYDKLFFKSYLKALDLDQETYFDRFLDFRREHRIDRTTSVIKINALNKEKERKILNHRNLFVILPFSLIVLVVAFLLINTEMVSTSTNGKVQEIDIVNVVDRMKAREQARKDSLYHLQDSIRVGSGVAVTIDARYKTWFRTVADKTDTSEYLLKKGQRVEISADSLFEFLIGRADGLHFYLNGKDLGVPDQDSLVVRYMRIDTSGVAVKLLKPRKIKETIKKNDENT